MLIQNDHKLKSCINKTRFNAKGRAEKAMEYHSKYKDKLKFNYYFCKFCWGYHLTRSNVDINKKFGN